MGFEACCTPPRRDHLDESSNRTMASPPSRNDGPGACASPRRRAPFDHLDSHRNRQERLTRDFYQPAAVTRQLIILIILVCPMHAYVHHFRCSYSTNHNSKVPNCPSHRKTRYTTYLTVQSVPATCFLVRYGLSPVSERQYALIGDLTRLGSLWITTILCTKSTDLSYPY